MHLGTFTRESRPESGLDRLMCAVFARQRFAQRSLLTQEQRVWRFWARHSVQKATFNLVQKATRHSVQRLRSNGYRVRQPRMSGRNVTNFRCKLKERIQIRCERVPCSRARATPGHKRDRGHGPNQSSRLRINPQGLGLIRARHSRTPHPSVKSPARTV